MDGMRRQTKWERLMFERARVQSSSVQKPLGRLEGIRLVKRMVDGREAGRS